MTSVEDLPEHVLRAVKDIPYGLRAWLRVREGDSREQYRFGLNDLRLAESGLQLIHRELALNYRELKIQLTLGSVAVPAFYVDSNAYDIESVRYARDDLEPGSTLDIEHFFKAPRQYLQGDPPFLAPIDILYAGSWVAHVGSESIGKTLGEGGKLEIVPREDGSSTSEL